jgi:hypothetical protein
VLVLKKKLPTVNGYCCVKYKEYGASRICYTCENGFLPKRLQPTSSVLPLLIKESPRKNATLVFLVARLSGPREPVNYYKIFKDLRASVEQSAEYVYYIYNSDVFYFNCIN